MKRLSPLEYTPEIEITPSQVKKTVVLFSILLFSILAPESHMHGKNAESASHSAKDELKSLENFVEERNALENFFEQAEQIENKGELISAFEKFLQEKQKQHSYQLETYLQIQEVLAMKAYAEKSEYYKILLQKSPRTREEINLLSGYLMIMLKNTYHK